MYALKETNVRNLSQQERQEAVNEIRLLASVQRNPGISGFHEAFIDGNRLCIVMEYAPFGDLSRALRKRLAQKKLLPEDLIWSYFIQIARGLQALHRQKILHRDVKTANVLRMSGEIVKLGDLGVAKLMKDAMTSTQIGTPHYMPPEVWRNRPYTFNSDVWALGCVLFEMCSFSVPFEARSMEELRFKVMKGKFPALPAVYSADMQKMVRWLMIAEPSQRPDIDAVLDHPSVRRRARLAPEPEPLLGGSLSANETGDAGVREPKLANGNAIDAGAGAGAASGGASDAPVTLGTIKVPKNLKMLKKRLPAPSYPSDREKALKEKRALESLEKERLARAAAQAAAQAAAAQEAARDAKGLKEEKEKEKENAAREDGIEASRVAQGRARLVAASASSSASASASASSSSASSSSASSASSSAAAAAAAAARAQALRLRAADPKLGVLASLADVPPLHKPANRENNLGNGYRARLGAGVPEISSQVSSNGGVLSARDRAAAAADRARLERERDRLSGEKIREIRAEMHRERVSEIDGNGRAEGVRYAAAPSRVKLPLISGNGAFVGSRAAAMHSRSTRESVPHVGGYAPAAPLPLHGHSENPPVANGSSGGKGNPGGVVEKNRLRVGLSNLSNLGGDGKLARGGGVAVRAPARRPAPMARNFYF